MLSEDYDVKGGGVVARVKDGAEDKLTTSTVQYWLNGSMMTAQMPLEEAKQLVRNGKAFVISAQAIGVETKDSKTKDMDTNNPSGYYKGFLVFRQPNETFEGVNSSGSAHLKGKDLDSLKKEIDNYKSEHGSFDKTKDLKLNTTPDEQFDPTELVMGIKDEMEHTDNEEEAKSIAKDHLAQDPYYYSKQAKTEDADKPDFSEWLYAQGVDMKKWDKLSEQEKATYLKAYSQISKTADSQTKDAVGMAKNDFKKRDDATKEAINWEEVTWKCPSCGRTNTNNFQNCPRCKEGKTKDAPSPADTYKQLKVMGKTALQGYARRVGYTELSDLQNMNGEQIITELISYLHGNEGDKFLENPRNFRDSKTADSAPQINHSLSGSITIINGMVRMK